jgi:FtsP/CotA-like multicopper oxidase with cupredoxin domain
VAVIAGTGATACAVAPAASAATREFWVAAVPAPTWNIAPTERDAIHGMALSPSQTVFPTVVYRRYTNHWGHPLPNQPTGSSNQDLIPGPPLRARAGDRLRVHVKNLDTLYRRPHSMHFHGVHYRPSSDGSFVPGVSGRDGDVKPGQSWTYKLTAGPDSVGVWPNHDHAPSMEESIAGGMYGMLSILGRGQHRPDREFEVVFAPMGDFQTIDGRAFVGNTPVFTSIVGQTVQWDVMAMGAEHHTFHVHATAGARRWASTSTRRPSARRRPSPSAGRRRPPAHGCTTATSKAT